MKSQRKYWKDSDRVGKKGKYVSSSFPEEVLHEINSTLEAQELKRIKKIPLQTKPVFCISYVPRSGSTLLYQLLAATGCFNYVSNFQSRFWLAPFLGGVLEKTLFNKFDFPVSFQSDYGRTNAIAAPGEFSYFWEHWLNFSDKSIHTLSPKNPATIDKKNLRTELNAMASMSELPLLFKKEYLGMNAGLILDVWPAARFIHIERDLLDTAISILKARKEVYGSAKHWWAAKPSGYNKLKKENPYLQIAGQIAGISGDIGKWRRTHPEKFITVSYERLIREVHPVLKEVAGFARVKLNPSHLRSIPKVFDKNKNQIDIAERKKLQEALRQFGY